MVSTYTFEFLDKFHVYMEFYLIITQACHLGFQ